jgi:hypothetical protein
LQRAGHIFPAGCGTNVDSPFASTREATTTLCSPFRRASTSCGASGALPLSER